jgi:uncharacterized protein DUF4412
MKITRCIPTALAFVVLASTAQAQGYSYDVTMSGTNPRGDGTVVVATSHGRSANGLTRVDVVQSVSPVGLMGKGTFTISNTAAGTTTYVDPSAKSYVVMNAADIAKESASAMGSVAKMTLADVHVAVEDLGAGEQIEGYATLKYRLTQSYVMHMSVAGTSVTTPMHSTVDVWVAPQLDGIMNATARPTAAAATGPMAELTNELARAYTKVKPGAILRMVTTDNSGGGGHARARSSTMALSNLKRETISPSVFQVPAGYTKASSLMGSMQGN